MGAHRSIPSEEVPAEVNRMVYGLTATLCLLVFMLDTLAPQGVASGVPYVAAVVLAFYSGSRRVVLATAVICSLLTLFGYVVSTSSGETELWRIVANRSLAIFAIWTTAAISAHFRGELGKRQHRPTTFLAFASLFTFLVLVSMNWLYFRNQEKTLQIVQRETQVATLSGLILYFDEALTMSARMAAETGDLSWEDRYRSHEKELAGALQQAEAIMRQLAVAEGAKTSADANDKLVAMENQVFDLVRHEQLEQASQLLNSSEYTVQKSIYQKGRDEYQERLEQVGRLRATEAEYNMWLHIVLSSIAIGLFIGIWIVGTRLHARWRRNEDTYRQELQQQTECLTKEVKQREIAQEQAVQAHEAVKMRVAELEQFNELAVGRELRMIELKQEVNDYAAKCGHLPVYDVQFGSQEVAH